MHGFLIPTILIIILAVCVLLPLWFKHRLYLKQLERCYCRITGNNTPD